MPIAPSLLPQLQAIVGTDKVLHAAADRWPYGYDNSRVHTLPDAVVFIEAEEQVPAVVKACREHGTPVVARGRGTGTVGGAVPEQAGVVLSLERLDRILAIDPDNRMARVQAGATNQSLQDAAAEHGFFWSPDPTSAAFCTIGGNLAFDAGGPRTLKYGSCRDNTLGLKAVTGSGEWLRTGVSTTKGVVGYDLTRLLIGSEGTLAIITEATLKLLPLPGAKGTLEVLYHDMHAAAAAVSRIMAQPVTPYALEFMDQGAIDMIRDYTETDLPMDCGGLLIVEVDGAADCLPGSLEAVAEAARGEGLLRLRQATGAADIGELWKMRKALSPALRNVAPRKINEDIVVPVTRIPELIKGLDAIAARFGIRIVNFGHAGNGNIHTNLMVDPSIPEQAERAGECLDEVFDLTLRLNGTLSGEHGVGMAKRAYVDRELDPVALQLMRAVKRQFDPDNILNPGKIFPAQSPGMDD